MKKYIKSLSIIYILMLIPQLLSSTILGLSYLLPLYIICYSVSIAIVFIYVNNNNISTDRMNFKYIVIYIFVLTLTFFSDIMIGVNIEKNDLFDAIIKVVNMLFFMCLIPKMKFDPLDLRLFYLMIFIVGVISCIYNIIINYRIMLSFTGIVNSYEINLSSFFANRNTYGMFLFISIFCSFFLIKYDKKYNKIYYSGIFLFLFNLIMTMSRGAIIATILFIFFYNYYNSKLSVKKTLAFVIIIGIFCCGGFLFLKLNPYYYSMISRLFIRSNVGTTGRGELWLAGYKMVRDNNLLNGVGFYTGLSLSNGYNQFHSFFIDNLVDGGILGLLFKTIIILRVYNYILRNDNKSFFDLKNIYKSGYIGLGFLCFFESVNFFSLGFSEAQFTILFITLPSIIFIQSSHNIVKKEEKR